MADFNQSNSIKVYTSVDCQFCQLVKAYLKTRSVDFEEVDVGQDPAAARELIERTGVAGLPVTVFNDEAFVLGFDRPQLDSYLADYGWA